MIRVIKKTNQKAPIKMTNKYFAIYTKRQLRSKKLIKNKPSKQNGIITGMNVRTENLNSRVNFRILK